MKSILLICILLTLQINANISHERNVPAAQVQNRSTAIQKPRKQIINCPDGSRSFILSKDDIYYSSSYKKFLFARKAAIDSCKKVQIRTKKGATICTRKKDMYRLLETRINKPLYAHDFASCLKLNRSIPLKIVDHFPFTFQITYYKAKYADKVFYVSSQGIYSDQTHNTVRKHTYRKYKKHHKKKMLKKHRKHYKKKMIKKSKIKKRKIRKIRFRKKKTIKRHHTSLRKKSLNTQRKESYRVTTQHNAPVEPTIIMPEEYASSIPRYAVSKKTKSSASKTSKNDKKNYTYRCVATYGEDRITVDNSSSMSAASDSIWRRCQALKTSDEICKIQDCYKLIK